MGLTIYLFTSDSQVLATMQEVAPDVVCESRWTDQALSADVCIWDLDLASELPSVLMADREEQQLILLVNERTLSSMSADLLARRCALVKPLKSYTVRAFLELATRTLSLRERAHEADQLRSDRDALVQYALAANLKLQEYDHQRTNFLARALHDLRAPLTALHGYCSLLADGQLGPVSNEQRELFHRMQSSTRRLSRQTTGMFDLIIRGHVRKEPNWTAADIEDAVDQAVYEVFPLLQDKDQTVAVNVAAAEKPFWFDPEQITQAVMNVLENCSKFTPKGGSIDIRGYSVACDFASEFGVRNSRPGTRSSNAYRIDIHDNGPGIQPDLLAAIFEQYTSYSGGRDRSGGGLGLAICKMVVAAHAGFIWADNREEGGASFSMVFPFQLSVMRPMDAASRAQAGIAAD
ncbi:MAG: HAMP domain-containing histidine kinase [Acidobacteriaceae bacterium]|nr:HAMP domain-containing histidine kinase [Acidobacteriaceae bacterium]